MQEPERVVLGKIRKYKGIGAKRRCVEKDETMHYVPVLKTLDVILQNETVLAEVRGMSRIAIKCPRMSHASVFTIHYISPSPTLIPSLLSYCYPYGNPGH